MTKLELREKYADEEWLARVEDLLSLTAILANSVLVRGYKIPEALTNALVFTDYGEAIRNHLITRKKVPVKEAKMLCFLTLLHQEPLIDIMQTQVSAIEEALGKQLLEKELLLPHVMGRELYDAAAAMFPDDSGDLGYEDTLKLLSGLSAGVYQSGRYTTGPYGLIKAEVSRHLAPRLRVPLYHCPDVNCPEIHQAGLSTDHNSPINAERAKLESHLEELGKPSEWVAFLRQATDTEKAGYEDRISSVLFFTLGDGLAIAELRILAVALVDRNAEFRGKAENIIGARPVRGHLKELDQAHLLQLLMQATDSDIVRVLDELIVTAKIEIPSGDRRGAVVSAGYAWGAFDLVCALGSSGVTFESMNGDIAPLRLNRLIESMYPRSDAQWRVELEWLLRRVDGPNLDTRIDEYLKSASCAEAVERLVLSSKRTVERACLDLGISQDWFTTDRDLVDAILWKLGFGFEHVSRPNAAFWESHERLANATSTLDVSAASDDRLISEMSVTFFRELEGVLSDALLFATWALLHDHVRAARPFVYEQGAGREFSIAQLVGAQAEFSKGSVESGFDYGARLTLEPLIQGFALLARCLEGKAQVAAESQRPKDEYPRFEGNTDLRFFPFKHVIPFLDLTDDSRSSVIAKLKEVRSSLSRGKVSKVRNDIVHFRRSICDVREISAALAEVQTAVRLLELGGFAPVEFGLARSVGSDNGRRLYMLRDGRGREIAFGRPSKFAGLGLPAFGEAQYLFPAAVYGHPNEMLRFGIGFESEFSKVWDSFPVRRQTTQAALARTPATGFQEGPDRS